MFSITILAVVVLCLSSAAIYYISEQKMLELQKQHSQSLLGQINYNIESMDEIVRQLSISLLNDNELRPLLYQSKVEAFELIKKMNRLRTVVTSSSYLDSVVFYNAITDTFYGEGALKTSVHTPMFAPELRAQIMDDAFPAIRLTALQSNGKVDRFAFKAADPLPGLPGESFILVNVKPKWLFDNIMLINNSADIKDNDVFLVHANGSTLNPSGGTLALDEEIISSIVAQIDKGEAHSSYFIHSHEKERYIVSYSDTAVDQTYMISIQKYDAVVGHIVKLRSTLLLLVSAFFVISVLVALWLGRNLYRPVKLVLDVVRTESVGGESVSSGDEFAYLSGTYRRMMLRLKKAEKEQRSNKQIVFNYQMRRLVSDSSRFEADEFWSLFSEDGSELNAAEQFNVVLFKPDEGLHGDENTSILRFALQNISEEVVSRLYPCRAADMRSDHVILILASSTQLNIDALSEGIAETQRVFAYLYKTTVSVSLGETVTDFRHLSRSYESAQQTMLYSPIYGREALIVPGMVANNMICTSNHISPDLERKLMEAIKSLNIQAIEAALDNVLEEIAAFHHDYLHFSLLHLLVIIKSAVKEMNDNRLLPVLSDLNSLSKSLQVSGTFQEFRTIVLNTFHDLVNNRPHERDDRNRILTETIKDIIKQNYRNSALNMHIIADLTRISADYASRQFKKVESISISDYINEVRLQEAVLMLEQTNKTVQEIMNEVGYTNQSYFFKLFKRRFGTTPRDYRLKKTMME